MDNEQITLIKKNLMKKLTPSRYEHTLGVAYTSAALSMRYGYDMDKAFMAGLLHDCAKYLSGERLLEKCARFGIEVSEAENVSRICCTRRLVPIMPNTGMVLQTRRYVTLSAAIQQAAPI